jgi:hypothetical protein
MTLQHERPTIEVLGLYSFNADAARLSRFIEEEIASLDPANFSEETWALLRRLGRHQLRPFTDDDRRQRAEEFRSLMDDAVMIEALVTRPDENFDIGAFVQPDPTRPEPNWQVAWNERFFTPDGEALIELDRGQRFPSEPQFRIAFVIHFWKPDAPLRSSYGDLPLPRIQPLPERLWRLAPYVVPG